jgi:DNA polymerase-3 subunit epsilon
VDDDLTLDGLDFITLPAARTEVAPVEVVELPLFELDDSPALISPNWAQRLGVFDLETTGIDTDTARIVSAHVGVLDADGTPIERSDWLADPGIEIPEQASAVHGITTERAMSEGRPASEVVAEIIGALRALHLRGIPVVIYNAPYDLTVLAREAARHEHEPLDDSLVVIDPLVLDRAVDRYRKGKRTLTAAAEHYGVQLVDAHDASADAIAAGRVAQALARRHNDRVSMTADELHAMQVDWCREQTESFVTYMRRARDPEFTASGVWPCR